jgi:hypothetical protein
MVKSVGQALPRGVPDSLKKRQLLNETNINPEMCREYGEKFLDLGLFDDALEFFKRAQYEPGLDKLKEQALANGDAYLMTRLGSHPPEVWRQVAEQALKLGKIQFARRAFEQAGDQEQADELASQGQRDDVFKPSQ